MIAIQLTPEWVTTDRYFTVTEEIPPGENAPGDSIGKSAPEENTTSGSSSDKKSGTSRWRFNTKPLLFSKKLQLGFTGFTLLGTFITGYFSWGSWEEQKK